MNLLLTIKCSQWSKEQGLDLELSPGLSLLLGRYNYLSHQLLSSRICFSRKLKWEMEMNLEPRHSEMGFRCLSH